MSFQDDLRTIVKSAKADKEEYERSSREFEKQWNLLRSNLIDGTFKEAAHVLNGEGIETYREAVNGSIVFRAVRNERGRYQHHIEFKANVRNRSVLCSSDLFDDESFSLEYVTESMVQGKVEDFVDRLFRKDIPD